ncbi:hypothetical protein [uncultured Desulfovibrio sp.]|uniref:hypothetical protein n=1 Tax=uncultured Desulfovibrio sp. TaxID=167968 RepID=UPI0025F26D08|nr:hypothetical protein [uncultured Desulfovibrio sp.]
MKKIILLACCMVLFSIGVCNADSDIDKLKGCWRSYGSNYEINDNYYKKIANDVEFELNFEETDTHIIMKTRHPKLKERETIRYILRESITDESFMVSKKKQTSPTEGRAYKRIECPK